MFSKLKALISQHLRQGLSQTKIAQGVALGLAIGVFPIYGLSSVMSLCLASLFRLNLPLVIAGLYAVTFFKPFLIVPFLRIGEFLFRADPLPINLVQLSEHFQENAWATLQEFGWSFFYATVGWVALLPMSFGLTYFILRSMIFKWRPHNCASVSHTQGQVANT
ncbi:DUF2062 domain-containing protein [Kiritimatiellota bacterium B12222]|nr:DUF2062 domain-containing protein [Kiritimatiellota bacterium B12222]